MANKIDSILWTCDQSSDITDAGRLAAQKNIGIDDLTPSASVFVTQRFVSDISRDGNNKIHITTAPAPGFEINQIAPEFNQNDAYGNGELITRGNNLYRFFTDHAAGAWNQNQVIADTVSHNIGRINNGGELTGADATWNVKNNSITVIKPTTSQAGYTITCTIDDGEIPNFIVEFDTTEAIGGTPNAYTMCIQITYQNPQTHTTTSSVYERLICFDNQPGVMNNGQYTANVNTDSGYIQITCKGSCWSWMEAMNYRPNT